MDLTLNSEGGCAGPAWPIGALHSPEQITGSRGDKRPNQSLLLLGDRLPSLPDLTFRGLGLLLPQPSGHPVGRACLSLEPRLQKQREGDVSGPWPAPLEQATTEPELFLDF